jgi:mono/diheme cytochrome c family protein
MVQALAKAAFEWYPNSMKRLIAVLLGLVALLVLAAGGLLMWAGAATESRLAQTFEAHEVDFPVPFPLTDEELAQLRAETAATQPEGAAAPVEAEPAPDPLADLDLDAIALERAVERGKHMVAARYVCIECHGADFGGGTMIDGMPMARIFGPNLTQGEGSVVKDYTLTDWDLIVRHGIKPDGRPALMPSEDFVNMSDRELSDILAYIGSMAPVDKPSLAPEFGPVGKMLVAAEKLPLSAEGHHDHHAAHAAEPPDTAVSVEFWKHLASVCVGCHRPDFSGGPIVGGDPSWLPASNLTKHAQGLEGWTFEDFRKAIVDGVRKDGSEVRAPMSLMTPYAKKMTDTELQALWTFIESLEAKPTGT